MKILIDKTPIGITPSTPVDKEYVDKMGNGTYEVEIKKDRIGWKHKMFFALIRAGFMSQEVYSEFDQYRKAIIVKSGFYDRVEVNIKGLGPVVCLTPKSIKYESMDDVEFDRLHSNAIDAILDEITDYADYEKKRQDLEYLAMRILSMR